MACNDWRLDAPPVLDRRLLLRKGIALGGLRHYSAAIETFDPLLGRDDNTPEEIRQIKSVRDLVTSARSGKMVEQPRGLVREFVALKTKLENLACEGRIPRVEDNIEWKNEFLVFPIQILAGLSLPADGKKAPLTEGKIRFVVAYAFVALRDVHRMGVVHHVGVP